VYDRFLSPTGRQLHESAIRRMGTVLARAADMVSFAAGYPDPQSFPWDELKELASGLLSSKEPGVLQYGPTRGGDVGFAAGDRPDRTRARQPR
jgi:DNA-binding transcriptional MocR family regulator